MWNFLHPDSKFMFYANKFCDLIALNILTLISCTPVITIGASAAAMHYVLLKIYRDELEGSVIRSFFRAFRSNFKQATMLWLVYLPAGILLGLDLLLFDKGLLPLPAAVKYVLVTLAVIIFLSMNWAFILQSRYMNTLKETVRNSFLFCAFHPLDTLLIGAILCIPLLLVVFFPQSAPIIPFCGFTLPGILSAALYHRIFIRHEQAPAAHRNTETE